MSSLPTSQQQDSTDDLLERLDATIGVSVVRGKSFADLTTLRIGGTPRAVIG